MKKVCIPKPQIWCKEYYVDTAKKNTKGIKTYITEQLLRNKETEQLVVFGLRDPFIQLCGWQVNRKTHLYVVSSV